MPQHLSKIPFLKLRQTGRIATTNITNELADAVNGVASAGEHGQVHSEDPGFGGFWGRVVKTGPLGTEDEYGDDRYWIKAMRFSNVAADPVNANVKTEVVGSTVSADYHVVTACNLAEATSRGHIVPLNTPVWVDEVVDQGDPPKSRFVFCVGQAEIFMKILNSTPVSGRSNMWSYSWIQQQYLRQGQWQDFPAGLTSSTATYGGAAYNSCEAFNQATSVQGNSVDISALPSGFNVKPVQGSPIVRAMRIFSCDTPAVAEWTFSYENAVQGACP